MEILCMIFDGQRKFFPYSSLYNQKCEVRINRYREKYMGKFTFDEINSMYFDVLREIGNIGAGNATTALAQMMQCKVDMSVPQVRLMEFKELGKIMGGEEIIMAGIYLGIEGDIAGSIMFLLEKQAHPCPFLSQFQGIPSFPP